MSPEEDRNLSYQDQLMPMPHSSKNITQLLYLLTKDKSQLKRLERQKGLVNFWTDGTGMGAYIKAIEGHYFFGRAGYMITSL